jgi:hypothetical protein
METEITTKRNYRTKDEPETPSHPGGVNEARREHIHDRAKNSTHHRDRGEMHPPSSRRRDDRLEDTKQRNEKNFDRDRDRSRKENGHSSQRKRSRSRSNEKMTDNDSDRRSRNSHRGSDSDKDYHSNSETRSVRRNSDDNGSSRMDNRRSDSNRSESSSTNRDSDNRKQSASRNHENNSGDRRSRGRDETSVRTDHSSSSARPSRSLSTVSQTPTRSGIGIDENEWEQPERLCTSSNLRGIASGTPLLGGLTPMTDRETGLRSYPGDTPLSMSGRGGLIRPSARAENGQKGRPADEWDKATPLRGGSISAESTSEETPVITSTDDDEEKLPSSTPRTALSRRAMQRAGFLVQDTPMLGEGDNGDGAIANKKNGRRSKYYDPDEEDDEFDRDFYLSEEGPTFDSSSDNSGSFLGSAAKFKQREDQMAKSRAKGEGKMAGMSAKKSQLHVDQAAWEDNRMLQSG